MGFVEVSPRRGVFVSQIDRAALKEIFELRIALEPMAMRLATPVIPIEEAHNALSLYTQAQNASPQGEKGRTAPEDRLAHP